MRKPRLYHPYWGPNKARWCGPHYDPSLFPCFGQLVASDCLYCPDFSKCMTAYGHKALAEKYWARFWMMLNKCITNPENSTFPTHTHTLTHLNIDPERPPLTQVKMAFSRDELTQAVADVSHSPLPGYRSHKHIIKIENERENKHKHQEARDGSS